MIDLDELEKLAKAATPGPWEVHNTDDAACMNTFYITENGGTDEDLDCRTGEVPHHKEIIAITLLQDPRVADHENFEDNAYYIAASNPQTVLSLIERVRLAEAEVAALREQTRWIPIGERLPEGDDIAYLTLSPNSEVFIMFWNEYWYSPFDENGDESCINVTHWMPLPPPPQEGEK